MLHSASLSKSKYHHDNVKKVLKVKVFIEVKPPDPENKIK